MREFPAVVERACLLMTIDSHDVLQGSAAINTVDTRSDMSQIKTQIDSLTEQVAAFIYGSLQFNDNQAQELSYVSIVRDLDTCKEIVQAHETGTSDLQPSIVLTVDKLDTPKKNATTREMRKEYLERVSGTPTKFRPEGFNTSHCSHNQNKCSNHPSSV